MTEESSSDRNASTEETEDEDATCCHRMTLCSPLIRDIVVTRPVSKYLRLRWSTLFSLATNVGIVLIGWTVLYLLLGDTMLPGNDGFGLYLLAMLSHSLGWTMSHVPYLNLPPMFGMLLAGLIVRNSGLYNIYEDLGLATISKIRTFCLTFIMIRAGLQLSITNLRKYSTFLMILAFIPSTVEVLVLALCCNTMLGYPWNWSFMTGTILACLSPVITFNCIIALAERGYGEDKDLASIICTAVCIDGILIVALFGLCYSFVFGNGGGRIEFWFYVRVVLRDFVLSIVAGVVLGVCFIFFPHRSHKYATWHRMICLVLGSLICTVAMTNVMNSGGGYLACVILSFTAITGWRTLSASFHSEPFRKAAHLLWYLVQPILVGVIGADIDLTDWSITRFYLHSLCITLGLTARSVATYFTTYWTPFTVKERLFVVVSWLPKGTLQAALGPLAYEHVQNKPDVEKVQLALDVVRISVITILFLAPIGAFVITFSGPILLNQINVEEHPMNPKLNYLRRLSLQPPQESQRSKIIVPEQV